MKKIFGLLLLTLTLTLTSCGGGATKSDSQADSVAATPDTTSNVEVNGDSDSGKAGALKTVYFDFNSAVLTGSTKATLDSNAAFLKENTSVQVQIEGHCDERGGVQFNIALGEKRAASIKSYLTAMGVDASRVSIISYGKERPVAFGHDDGAWSQNRRGNFVVTAK